MKEKRRAEKPEPSSAALKPASGPTLGQRVSDLVGVLPFLGWSSSLSPGLIWQGTTPHGRGRGRCRPGVSRASGAFPPLVGGGGEGPEGYYTTLESMGVGVVWGVLWLRGPGLWFQDAWIERSRRCIDGSDMGGQIEFSMRRFQMNPDAPVARG